MKIYVGNLPPDTDEAALRTAFEAHGAVSTVSLTKDRFTGRSREFGFVEMPTKVQAKAAIHTLDGQDFGGRPLEVHEAKPRQEQAKGGRRGGRRF